MSDFSPLCLKIIKPASDKGQKGLPFACSQNAIQNYDFYYKEVGGNTLLPTSLCIINHVQIGFKKTQLSFKQFET